MVLIGLSVMDVIEAVDAAGRHAERDKCQDTRDQIARIKEVAVKEQGQEDKEVLDPLLRS